MAATFGRIVTGLLLGAALPGAALAQDAVTEEERAAGEIVITARRVNEALAEVPASITAFDADTIRTLNIQSASDFTQLTPGVTIVSSTADAGDVQINIRGINGARDAESSVALLVDGILKTNTAALDQNQGTVRQIEVLKGPQGALYGRNAAAGAIVLQTLRPGSRLEGGVRASYANVETIDTDAYLAGPLTDRIGFVLSGNYFATDGFFRNEFLANPRTVDDRESWNVNGRVIAELSDRTSLDLKARYGQLAGASIAFNASFHLPNFAAVNPAFYEDVNAHPFRFYSNIRPTNDQETFELSAKLDHDFGAVTLSAWALYSDIRNDLVADGTSADFARYIAAADPAAQPVVDACFGSTAALTGFPLNPPTFIGQIPVPFIFAPANGSTFGAYSPTTCDGTQYQVRNQRDVSGEIRLASNGDERIDWQVGAYYLNISRKVGVSLGGDTGQGVIRNLYNPPDSANPTSQLLADRFKTDVYAAFGSVDVEVTDSFDLGVALRYDVERRRVRSLVPTALDPFTGGPINPGQAFGPIQPQRATFEQLQPKITARWEVLDDTFLFANWGIGFKSGGFNNQGSAAIVDQNFNQFLNLDPPVLIEDRFAKERSSAFEAGFKGRAGPINFSLAGYHTRVRDMQFFEFFVGSFGLLRVVSNIDRVNITGAELNVDVEPVRGWKLYGALNVTDSEIKRNRSRPDTIGNESPYTSDYTINVGSSWTFPMSETLDFFARADYRLTGPTWFHTVQDQEKPTLFSGLLPISALALPGVVGNARYDVNQRDEFGLLDLRVGLQTERWRITAFANNFLNEDWVAEVIPAIEFGGSFISPGARRLYGLELGYRF
jgi:iron complex outermembrane receptor protein